MHFKDYNNQWEIFLFTVVASFIAGITVEDRFNFPTWGVILIGLGTYVLFCIIHYVIVRFTPLKKIQRKIQKQPYKHQQLKIFFDEYIPKTKEKYPKTIYKYIALDDISDSEREIFNSHSSLEKLEKYILTSSTLENNSRKLHSLTHNSLWFTQCSNPKLNDPFEGKRILYDDEILPFSEEQIQFWKQYAEFVRNNLFLCCFSKKNDSPPMWANYANNYKGYCLEFEVLTSDHLWEIEYSYGKIVPNFEIDKIEEDLCANRITRNEAYEYIKQLHIHWATSKYGDWKYEDEIRALFFELDKEKNITYDKIGIKLSAIIVGHNCAEEHRRFLTYIAKKLSIPIKITTLNTTGIDYLNI